ncbi:hypothetical protein HNR46_003911 [Haloferula luteola]|uniref:J domain-containing protein n=2 Tax=Haloferula luteola TaxID=595692 RepID=A0A840VIH7_9BACT|nr:hypothetical protein [Haloferula luteola]
MDAFAELGLERRLEWSGEALRAAFREAGKTRHPDGGGTVEGFERLQQALACLIDPGARLRHWLELEGREGELRGAVGPGVMDFFSSIGPVLQEADGLLKEREGAQSQLARALLEPRIQECREKLEGIQEQLDVAREERESRFPEVERGELDGWTVARELAFFGKWSAQIRAKFAAMW